jgi:predicted NBD/HSP70 family sugar kinase
VRRLSSFEGKNLEDVQEMNRSLIIRLLQRSRTISRADLAKRSGLKQATITNIINDFINWGLVEETGLIEGEKGRRSIGLGMRCENYKVISVRLSRKYFHIAVFDVSGKQYQLKQYAIDSQEELELLLETISKELKKIIAAFSNDRILGIGIAIPGPLTKAEGSIVFFTGFVKWQNIDITKHLKSELGLPVYLEQDANAASLAEWTAIEDHNENETVLCIMVGQGIGAGIVDSGKLLLGKLGIAGEIGHMSLQYDGPKCECGNYGCMDVFCSTSAVLREIRSSINDFPNSVLSSRCTIGDVIAAYRDGDELAKKVINKAARYLGYGIASLTNVINPGTIIIGDEMSKAGEAFLNEIIKTVKSRIQEKVFNNTKIILSKFEDDPALIGASYLVINEAIKQPKTFIHKNNQV